MSNNITLKKSSVADKVPLAADLQFGELALNYADGNLFYKNSSNVVTTLTSNKFVSVTGNITGGNIAASGNASITGNVNIGGSSSTTITSFTFGYFDSEGPYGWYVMLTGAGGTLGLTAGQTVTLNFDTGAPITVTLTDVTYVDGNGELLISWGATAPSGTSLVSIVTSTTAISSLSATGNITGNYFVGNGSALTGITATVAPAGNVDEIQFNAGGSLGASANLKFTGSNLSVVGNVTANNFIGNISGSNVVGSVSSANSATSANTANDAYRLLYQDTGDNRILPTAAGINVSGNISVLGGNVSATQFTSSIATGTAPFVVASTTQVANLNAATAGTVTTAAQPNITSVGTLTSVSVSGNVTSGPINSTGYSTFTGNVGITGNLLVSGNVTYVGVQDLTVSDPLIYLAANNVGDLDDIGFVGNWNDGVYQHGGLARDHADGVWKFFSNVVAEPTTTVDWGNAVYDTVKVGNLNSVNAVTAGTIISAVGNITGNYFVGNGSQLTGIVAAPAGNIDEIQYNAGGLTGASANLTFNGSTLSVVGNISSGNIVTTGSNGNISGANVIFAVTISATGNVVGNNIIGNGAFLTAINGASVTGAVANATYAATTGSATTAGTVTTNAQPNITSVGTLSSLSVSGNITGSYFIGNGSQLTGLPASYSNANVAAYLPTYTGNLASLTGPVTTTANITGNYFIGNGALLTGITAGTSYSNANVAAYLPTYTGNLASLTGPVITTANITAGNIITSGLAGNITGANVISATTFSATGNITGSYFIGNGSTLTNITGANVTGTVANATYATSAGSAGTAVNATNATNAALVSVTLAAASSDFKVPFADTTVNVAGYYSLLQDSQSTFTYNPGTNTLTTGNITSGNITGNYFIGNGSQLTGLPASGLTWTTVANTAPAGAKPGDFWYNSFSGIKYQYINDGTSNVWVDQSYPTTFSSLAVAGNGTIGGTLAVTGNVSAPLFVGTATQARYADLAENYSADAEYTPGTVLVFGGTHEVTVSAVSHDTRVAGVVSTAPAYLMNSAQLGAAVALTGKVPCQVQGPVTKGDLLVNISAGTAGRLDPAQYRPGCVVGKSLESIPDKITRTIEIAVGRF